MVHNIVFGFWKYHIKIYLLFWKTKIESNIYELQYFVKYILLGLVSLSDFIMN